MLCPLLIAGMASAVTYSVAGSSAALFGASWDPANTSTDMTSTDGVNYTFSKENVTLSQGQVLYKVVVDHSWDTSYGQNGGEGNAVYSVPEDGVYDVVISFNAETHVPSMVATKTGSATVEHTWSIIGKIFGTNWDTDWDMTLGADGKYTYTATDVVLAQGNYEYKARADKKWELSYPSDNAVLSIPEDGTYDVTFTLDVANSTVDAVATKKGGAVIEATYTVAGTPDVIFGTVWDATNTANDMTESNGIYTFTKAGVELSEGDDILFKVVKNHDWSTSYGTAEGGDINYKVNVTGSHDITITFDPAVGIPEITLTDDEAAAYDYTQHAYRVCGTDLFGGWGATEGDATVNPMTLTDGKFVWTKADYVVTSDNKTGHSYRIRVDNQYMENVAPFNIAGISSNNGFEFDKVGTYDITITFDPATATVSHELTRHAVPAKDYTVKVVNSGNWDAMNVFAWNDGGSITGAWPGTAATMSEEKAGEFSIYTYTFENLEEDAVPTQIIFNAGNNMPQTADLTFEDGKTYWAVTTYGIEGTAFGGWKDGAQYRGIERILTDQGNGIYTYTTDAVLTANTPYPYRVSVDGAWTSIGIGGVDGNKEFTVDADGTYTLVATLNTNYEGEGARTLDVVATLKTEDTYTIVGEKDIVNGSASWNLTETANDMTENEGVWTLTVEGAKLETGKEYLYKMVKNHAWGDGEVPAQGNQTLTVEETAEYTITYTYDGTDLSYSATKTGEYTPEPVDGQELVSGDHKVVIKGIHYTNLDENNYVLTIKSEETMTGLGGSFWSINGVDGNDMREVTVVEEEGKKLVLTVTSNQDPEIYTPLYVMMLPSDQVTFTGNGRGNSPVIEWEEQQAEVTYQVTFVNEAGWEGDIYAYAWSGDGAAEKVLGEWPGTQMENEGNNTFSITLPSAAEYIIFNNNNGSQTADLAFVNNKQYTNAEESADSYTVKFVNIAGWNDVYVYGWDGSTNSGWDANKAEKTSTVNVFGVDADVYECTISLSVEPKNLIFHNGDGTQTQDLQWVEGATYSYDDTEKGYFLFTDDADQFKPVGNINVAAKASYARQFTPGNVCTVVLPFAIGADVAKAAGKFYRINSIADGYIRGTEETPAPYVPYIFVPAIEYPFTNIGIGQLPAVQNNSITTAEGYTLQFVTGTTEIASDASYDYYGFSNGKFVKAAYAVVNPFRSYIKVAKSANAPATLIWTDDEATGISSLKADIQNGKADVYDLQGRRVLNPVRGLYIVNGKKVIVK